MYKLNFTLKQHTPIIHFQHEQEGATLRATEMKPKLDRYIIEKCSGWENTPDEWKQKLNDPKNQALNYKIRIYPFQNTNITVIERNDPFPPFFANMGNDYALNKKSFNYYNQPIICEIKTHIKELYDHIIENNILPEFFALNNFGTRQSKGYGSFTVRKINGEEVSFPSGLFQYRFKVAIDNSDFNNYKLLFEKVDAFYRTLRSGINMSQGTNKLYIKSLLFMYVNSALKLQWDKKTIKKQFLDSDQSTQCDLYDDEIVCNAVAQAADLKNKNFRDLFGLSSKEAWFRYFNLEKTEAKQIENGWVEKGNSEIEIKRFKSPMFFKIIRINDGFRVYFTFMVDHIYYDNYVNSTFLVKTDRKEDSPFALPFYKDFDYFTYMDWVINNIEIEDHIEISERNDNKKQISIKKTIVDIYNQLKAD